MKKIICSRSYWTLVIYIEIGYVPSKVKLLFKTVSCYKYCKSIHGIGSCYLYTQGSSTILVMSMISLYKLLSFKGIEANLKAFDKISNWTELNET